MAAVKWRAVSEANSRIRCSWRTGFALVSIVFNPTSIIPAPRMSAAKIARHPHRFSGFRPCFFQGAFHETKVAESVPARDSAKLLRSPWVKETPREVEVLRKPRAANDSASSFSTLKARGWQSRQKLTSDVRSQA